jgi:hypothetical protein
MKRDSIKADIQYFEEGEKGLLMNMINVLCKDLLRENIVAIEFQLCFV